MGQVVSLGEKLRLRREELGISQAQAARELDVARTAYRLWEMEAAKPAPDRWRLISRWLGVSVATMLLAEELIDESEATEAAAIADRLGGSIRGWDELSDEQRGDYFAQERATIADQVARGAISASDSGKLSAILDRVQGIPASAEMTTWTPTDFRKELPRSPAAPALARAAVAVAAVGIPAMVLQDAQLLTSEIVTNGVQHVAVGALTMWIQLGENRLRVEVADEGTGRVRPRAAGPDGGWGLTIVTELADRWGSGMSQGRHTVWFEFDL